MIRGVCECDRLTTWTLGGTTQTYTYNTIGNITSKPGSGVYTYPLSGPTSVRPHTPSTVNSAAYSYDANGNLTAGGGRTYTWTIDNLPASISHVSGTENYSYDALGERVKKVAGSVTTVYLEGLWEEVAGGATKVSYTFNNQVVALRESATNVVTYLHGDHLGSASVATTAGGAVASSQEYDAWGKVRAGGITQTSINYTGQRLDGTGLLYYHARMYDPLLGRFVSADSVVPGSASGSMDGIALKPLTVDFHEPGFVSSLNGENGQPFWFQLSDEQRKDAGTPWGPANPQALNRYSYVLNNPLRYVDPSGRYLAPDHFYNKYVSYETVIVPEERRGDILYDTDGNRVYADKETGVLYRIDENGNKQRLYRVSTGGRGCDGYQCKHKYVYEDDAGFKALKQALYDRFHTSATPSVGSIFGLVVSCIYGKATGCVSGALLTWAGAEIDAGIVRGDALVRAYTTFSQLRDSFRTPRPIYGPPRPFIAILK